MKNLSRILLVIYLFTLSIMPSVIILKTSITHTEINKAEITALCKAVGRSYCRKGDSVRIATYNLLADGIGYYGGRGSNRADGVCNLVASVDADVIGLQEVSRWWFCNIKGNTPYVFIDPLRTELGGFMTAIIYNPERVTALEYGNIPLQRGSNYRLRRIVWALFKINDSGRAFCVINTHLNLSDTDSSVSIFQAQQFANSVRQLNEKYNCPVVVTGDFNAKKRGAVTYRSSVVYDLLSLNMADTHYTAVQKRLSNASDHNRCLDHIFTVGRATVKEWVILSQKPFKSLSDHYLIFTDIGL